MNAQPKHQLEPGPSEIGTVADGGYLVSDATLAFLGDGNIKEGRAYLRSMIADERPRKTESGPAIKPVNVRIAGPEDEAQIVALIIEDLSRTISKWAPIAPDRILEHVQNGTRQKGGIVGVIESDGRIVACTVLGIAQPAHSNVWYLHEIWNIVHRHHRKSTYARDLIDFCKWCSDEWTRNFGFAVYVIIAVNAVRDPRWVLRFFRRYLRQIGGTFIYPSV
jgi:hypothetical protein